MDISDACEEMKDKFQSAFESLEETRTENEVSIINNAKSALQEAKVQLNANSPIYGHGKLNLSMQKRSGVQCCFCHTADTESDIRLWHGHQLQREDALRRIELEAIEQLSDCWEKHDKKRAKLIEDHVSGLSVFFLSNGESYLFKWSILITHCQ